MEGEHQANDNYLKKCDFCGEQSELFEGVCEQCKALRNSSKNISDLTVDYI